MKIGNFYGWISGSKLARAVKWTYQTLLFLSGLIIFLAMVGMVLLRYVFGLNLFGMDEIILCFVFWFYFFGGINGSMEDSQVRADVVTVLVKNERVTWAIRIFTRIIELAVLVFLSVQSIQLFITNCNRMPATQGLKIPYIIPQFAIVVGFILMFFYDLGHLLKAISYPPKPKSEAKDE